MFSKQNNPYREGHMKLVLCVEPATVVSLEEEVKAFSARNLPAAEE